MSPSVVSLQCSPPTQVSRHLSKLFDSLCKLKFRLDADKSPLKVGLGMYSKEDEYMDFDRECDLSGQVGGRAGRRGNGQTHAPPGARQSHMSSSRVSLPARACPALLGLWNKCFKGFLLEFPAQPPLYIVACGVS